MDLREARLGPTRRHPWERARAVALARILAEAALPPRPAILDIGCGDGWLLAHLGDRLGASRRVGVDPALAEPGVTGAAGAAGAATADRPAAATTAAGAAGAATADSPAVATT